MTEPTTATATTPALGEAFRCLFCDEPRIVGAHFTPAKRKLVLTTTGGVERDAVYGMLQKAHSNATHASCCQTRGAAPLYDLEEKDGVIRAWRKGAEVKKTETLTLKWAGHGAEEEDEEDWRELARDAALCGLGVIVGFGAHMMGWDWVSVGAYALAMLAGGRDPAVDAWEKIREGELDIHFLMLAVAVGAACVGAWAEGALLLFLFALSGALEHYAEERTNRSIKALFKSAPQTATYVNPDGVQEVVPVGHLGIGDKVLVKPGEMFPVDARLVEGKTEADESALTGESIPVLKSPGDLVYGGTLNLWGAVTATVARPADDSALQKIIRLVEEARHTKARAQRFTDKFGTGYTYLVLGMTVAAFLVWWLVFGVAPFSSSEGSNSAFYRAMTLLVVASPCALVLSIPSAILASIAAGARQGILFKGGSSIEKLAEIDAVCFDKTGTLTTGELEVVAVESYPENLSDRIITIANSLEQKSAHPLAKAITKYCLNRNITIKEVRDFASHDGLGVSGEIGGLFCRLGRREWLLDTCTCKTVRSEDVPLPETGFTEVWVCVGETYGRILLKDCVRQQSAPVIAQLERWGIKPVMLTGDRIESASAVGKLIGLKGEHIFSGLKPEDKVARLRELEAQGHRVAMVGDGVNDAPCLAAAYVSVGMGARGSDAALEQSEVVLMEDKIEKFLTAFELSRQARAIIRQNLAISLGTIVLMVAVALGGAIPLTLGVIAHEGSTVIVCLNSLRLLLSKRHVA